MAEAARKATVVELYMLYENPADHPGKFVLRRWVAGADGGYKPDEVCCVASTIEEAREKVPAGMKRQARLPDDHRAIAEIWV